MQRPFFLRRVMLAPAIVLICALFAGVGCAPAIGDSCETSQECPTGAICDVTAPDGYCAIDGCQRNDCPEDSVCVVFDRETSFCMQYCESDEECRSNYACRDDVGDAGFCYVPDEAPVVSQ